MSHRFNLSVVSWALLALAACGTILDIQDAQIDPLLVGGSGGTANTGGAGGDPVGDLCQTYCDTVQANCVGADQVYANEALCLGICDKLPPGAVGDMSGNTVGCRLTNAVAADTTGEPSVHCPIAGPGGDGTCGSNCEGYCATFQQVCAARFAADFDGISDCIQTCTDEVPDIGGYNSGIQDGNSIQCRLYHLSAATDQPGLHCGHAAGDAPCVDGAAGGGAGSGGAGSGGAGGN